MIHRFRVSSYAFWGLVRDDWCWCSLEDVEQTVRRLWRPGVRRLTVWDSQTEDCYELLDVGEVVQLVPELAKAG